MRVNYNLLYDTIYSTFFYVRTCMAVFITPLNSIEAVPIKKSNG